MSLFHILIRNTMLVKNYSIWTDRCLYDSRLLSLGLDTSELLQCPTSTCNLEKQYGGVGKSLAGRKKNWQSTPGFTGPT